MSNPRTKRLVTALVERYPEFRAVKPEWFAKQVPYACSSCIKPLHGNPMTPPYEDLVGGYRCLSCGILHSSEYHLTPPDLTDRDNLAELFDVCAFLGYVRTSSYEEVTAQIRTPKEVFFVGRKTLVDALLAAAELALRLEPWEETTP